MSICDKPKTILSKHSRDLFTVQNDFAFILRKVDKCITGILMLIFDIEKNKNTAPVA